MKLNHSISKSSTLIDGPEKQKISPVQYEMFDMNKINSNKMPLSLKILENHRNQIIDFINQKTEDEMCLLEKNEIQIQSDLLSLEKNSKTLRIIQANLFNEKQNKSNNKNKIDALKKENESFQFFLGQQLINLNSSKIVDDVYTFHGLLNKYSDINQSSFASCYKVLINVKDIIVDSVLFGVVSIILNQRVSRRDIEEFFRNYPESIRKLKQFKEECKEDILNDIYNSFKSNYCEEANLKGNRIDYKFLLEFSNWLEVACEICKAKLHLSKVINQEERVKKEINKII